MCQTSSGASDPSCTDLNNAKQGLRDFVQFMDPTMDKIGLAVFPPASSVGHAVQHAAAERLRLDLDAVHGRAALARTTRSATNLNDVLTARLDDHCLKGGRHHGVRDRDREGPGRARRTRPVDGPGHHRVLLRRGRELRAHATTATRRRYRRQPCRQGITSAASVKSRGTKIYSIGYDLNACGGGANVCKSYTGSNESPAITAYSTISQISSGAGFFFNQPAAGRAPDDLHADRRGDLGRPPDRQLGRLSRRGCAGSAVVTGSPGPRPSRLRL